MISLLAGCGGSPKPEIAIATSQAVDQPADCERVLQEQRVVEEELGADYRGLFARAQDGQIIENKIIARGRACMAKQRALYKAAK